MRFENTFWILDSKSYGEKREHCIYVEPRVYCSPDQNLDSLVKIQQGYY